MHATLSSKGRVLALLPAFKNSIFEGVGLLKGEDSLAQAIVDEHRQERGRE